MPDVIPDSPLTAAPTSDAPESSPPIAANPEQATPMIDVHAPHHSIDTWREFFIHIATIVVGLLIAVALEQTVEFLHARHELDETRAEIAHEQKSNEALWATNESHWRGTFVELKNDLIVLKYIQDHPGTPQTALPGVLRWAQSPFIWNHAVWDAAQVKGVVQRMRLEESNNHQEYYGLMTVVAEQSLNTWNAINAAHSFDLLDPDPTHLSPERLDQVIQLTLIAMEKHVLMGYSLGRFANEFPEHPHTLTWDVIETLRPTAETLDPTGTAQAQALTRARLKAANSGKDGSTVDSKALE